MKNIQNQEIYNNNMNFINNQNNNHSNSKQQPDPNSLPLPQRLKHHKWSARKDVYQQLIYIIQNINNLQQEFDIGGKSYKINKLIPLLQNLVDQKHPVVLIEGLRCVELILILSKENNKCQQFIRLIDKGIQIFPLFTQQRKAILEKFLDILELSQIDPQFLKNKLGLPHEKSVMYVAEVIGALNVYSLRQYLVTLSKKHPKSCVRELCAQIAQELAPNEEKQESDNINNSQLQYSQNTQLKTNQKKGSLQTTNTKSVNISNNSNNSNATKSKILVIDKISCYQKLTTKDQQSFSTQLLNNIAQVSQYTSAQLPNFSHILRLMIDDNNHIISTNGVKVLTYLINKSKSQSISSNNNSIHSLIPASFPLLFIFNKFKLHKTHPVNTVMLELVDSILCTSRLQDLIHAIHEGLSSIGSKANVKFGCSLSYFRILSLIYRNQDLFLCTSQTLTKDFQNFSDGVNMTKNSQKLIFKILDILSKDKKYDNEVYLIKNAIGLNQYENTLSSSNNQQQSTHNLQNLATTLSPKQTKQIYRNKSNVQNISGTSNLPKKLITTITNDKVLSKTGGGKTVIPNQYQKISLQSTLQDILKQSQANNINLKNLKNSIQKSSEEFFQCIKQQRYEMFYLCELIQSFISMYQPNENTMQKISDYLINILKIISFLKPTNDKNQKINYLGICFLLKISLCRLSLGQEMLQILENLSRNFDFKQIFNSLLQIIIFSSKEANELGEKNYDSNYSHQNLKLKKKNKKYLLLWLENNTPAFMLNQDYYSILQKLNEKQKQKEKQKLKEKQKNLEKVYQYTYQNQKQIKNQKSQKRQKSQKSQKNQKKSIKQLLRYQEEEEKKEIRNDKRKRRTQNQNQNDHGFKKTNNNKERNQMYMMEQKKQKNQQYKKQGYYYTQQKQKEKELNKIKINNNHYINNNNNDDQNYQNYEIVDYIIPSSDQIQKIDQLQNIEISKIYMRNLQSDNGENEQFTSRSSFIIDQQLNLDSKWKYFLNKHNINNNDNQNAGIIDTQIEKQSKFIQVKVKVQVEDQQDNNVNVDQHHQDSSKKSKIENSSHFISKNSDTQKYQQSKNKNQKEQIRQFFDRMKPDFDENENKNKNNNNLLKSKLKQKQQQKLQTIYQKQKQFQNKNQYFYQNEKSNEKDKKNEESFSQQSIITDSTTKLEFTYRFLNAEKVSYMLQTTANPYPHLRTLILIPFKSSPKKPSFLKQLLHYMQELNFSKFTSTTTKPYESIVLLTILLFSEIKQDKSLIGPLQSLYEFIAKQSSTTNQFLKIIVSLFHSVIEETLKQNRKFLITILLKSMIRMIPFVQCSLQLLRDIQQFYQIGQMVYFQMFQEEYGQIRQYLEGEALEIMIEKALSQEQQSSQGYSYVNNLKMIIEGFMTTQFKKKALAKIEQFQNGQSVHEYSIMDDGELQQEEEEGQVQNESQQQQQEQQEQQQE